MNLIAALALSTSVIGAPNFHALTVEPKYVITPTNTVQINNNGEAMIILRQDNTLWVNPKLKPDAAAKLMLDVMRLHYCATNKR